MNKKNDQSIIRSELNIEKWALFTTSNNRNKSRTIVRYKKLSNGDIINQKVIIGKVNNTEVEIFRIFDFKIFCVLIHIWEQQGKPINKKNSFSIHQIATILGLSWGKTTHRKIKESLVRLRSIPITWINSFYNCKNQEQEELLKLFNILSELTIFQKKEI